MTIIEKTDQLADNNSYIIMYYKMDKPTSTEGTALGPISNYRIVMVVRTIALLVFIYV